MLFWKGLRKMRSKKGFTLVELLAVISVLAIVMVIVIPAVSNNSKTAKEGILKTKLDLIVDQSIIWGQDHINYFVNESAPLQECTTSDGLVSCKISFDALAKEGYVKYDDGEIISDPTKRRDNLNNEKIDIVYDKKKNDVSATYDSSHLFD